MTRILSCFGLLLAICAYWAQATADQTQSKLLKCEIVEGQHFYDDSRRFEIDLWKSSEFGEPMHCVFGTDLGDLTPCAPDGGYGLSRGTGSAGLIGFSSHWLAASDHFYGKFAAVLAPSEFFASATFGEGTLPSFDTSDADLLFLLQISRVTGKGKLRDENGLRQVSCEAIERKF